MALDIRAYPTMLHDFTALLVKLDFESAGESHEGHQHRWKRGDAIVDVLIPTVPRRTGRQQPRNHRRHHNRSSGQPASPGPGRNRRRRRRLGLWPRQTAPPCLAR
jgi:hypothetical protein